MSSFGAWLAGSSLADARLADGQDQRNEESYRGQRLGLPRSGAGSVAAMGKRFSGFVIDCVLAGLITSLFVHPHFTQESSMQAQNYWSVLTWLVITVVGTSLFGITPGMAVFGIRVVRLDGANLLGPIRAIARALLITVIIPAVIWDIDYRGLQDKAAGTIVVNTR